ncbi:MAG: putative cation transport protein [Leptospirillum sp. Group IV 'UBA BS']|nr:MAG: putative cation transport protein [Leptospirillum sp. Group IV 'UBA BS']
MGLPLHIPVKAKGPPGGASPGLQLFSHRPVWFSRSAFHRGSVFETAGDCTGIAYLVPEEEEDEILDLLTRRHEAHFLLRESTIIVNGQSAEEAYFFISDRNHPDYIGKIVPQEVVKIAQNGKGPLGSGVEFILLLSEKMTELGIMDLAVDAATSLLKWHGFGNQQTHRTHF